MAIQGNGGEGAGTIKAERKYRPGQNENAGWKQQDPKLTVGVGTK